MKLYLGQKKVLAEFCANFAVAWLAGGIIGPYVAGGTSTDMIKIVVAPLISSAILFAMMLSLMKGVNK